MTLASGKASNTAMPPAWRAVVFSAALRANRVIQGIEPCLICETMMLAHT